MGFERIEALSTSPLGLSIVKTMQARPRRRRPIDDNAFVLTGAS